jgi:molybdenum cofactor guanylyltransferase
MIAAIQAGGRSTRMKTDKAWLMIDDQPMIERVLITVQSITEKTLIIINETNSRLTDYQDLAKKSQTILLPDAHDFRGPLGGIETALRNMESADAMLILACDLPFVSSIFLQFLISIHQSNEALLTVPIDESGRPQMLCAIYSRDCLDEINRMLAANELKTRLLCEHVTTNFVHFEKYAHLPGADKFLLNLNTPEEYKLIDSIT